MKAEKIIVSLIVLFTFLVLLYASSSVLLNGSDEEEHFFMAGKISFNPRNLNLPFAFEEINPHPLLEVYLIKLGFLLFGREGILSGRFMFALLGALGILLVYSLVKSGLNRRAALFSILLLSLEKYYICHMRYAISESACIFFTILSVYLFFKALREDNRALMVLVGVSAGIGFYGKATLTLLFPIFLIYLLWDKRYRFWLQRKEPYLALLAFWAIAAPFIIYNFHHNLFTFRYINYVTRFGLSPLSAAVLFGEPLSLFFDDSAVGYIFDREYPLMNWAMGIIVFCGVVYSAAKSREASLVKLLLVIFFFTFILFTLIANNLEDEPNSFCRNINWPSMMVMPGVVLAGDMLSAFWNRYRRGRVLIILFIGYLMFDLIRLINLPESFYIQRREMMIKELSKLAHYDLDRGYYNYARRRFRKILSWSRNEEEMRDARRSLSYISRIEKDESKDYYVPTPKMLPSEVIKQANFFNITGDKEGAAACYRRVIKLTPDNIGSFRTHNNLDVIFTDKRASEGLKQRWIRISRVPLKGLVDKADFTYRKMDSMTASSFSDSEGKDFYEAWFKEACFPGINYASSYDGYNWIKILPPEKRVLQGTGKSGDWNEKIKCPEVSYFSDRYYMLFTGYNSDINDDGDFDNTDYSGDGIGITVSSKPEEGWKEPVRIIRRAGSGDAWDYGYVGDCSPLVFDPIERRFHLWYTGCNIFSGQEKKGVGKNWGIGHAFTDSGADPLAAISWHKSNPEHPKGEILSSSNSDRAFDSDKVSFPCVVFNDNKTSEVAEDDFFEMWYTAYSRHQETYSIGYTTSATRLEAEENNARFGALWRNPRFVVYAENKKDDFSQGQIYKPIRKAPGNYVYRRK